MRPRSLNLGKAIALVICPIICLLHYLARFCSRPRNQENYPAESAAQYWKRTVTIPFLDVISSELKSRFGKEKRAHYEPCAVIPQVITSISEEATVELAHLGTNL